MVSTGLVSISFRKLSPKEIIQLVAKAGLKGIEWGGDVHVPHGNTERAREVKMMTRDAGLCVPSYGSYYKVGCKGEGYPDFEDVLETALTLEAPVIRVWAGDRGSADADKEWWENVISDSRRIADMAQKENILVAYEFHRGTLTDTADSARKLLESVAHPNIKCYWQPPVGEEPSYRLEGLKKIKPWLSHIHVFQWIVVERRPLAEGLSEWQTYMDEISKVSGDRFAMLEFVKGDEPQQFLKDAETLKILVK